MPVHAFWGVFFIWKARLGSAVFLKGLLLENSAYFQKSKLYFLKSKPYFFENVMILENESFKIIFKLKRILTCETICEGGVKDMVHPEIRINKGTWIGEGEKE